MDAPTNPATSLQLNALYQAVYNVGIHGHTEDQAIQAIHAFAPDTPRKSLVQLFKNLCCTEDTGKGYDVKLSQVQHRLATIASEHPDANARKKAQWVRKAISAMRAGKELSLLSAINDAKIQIEKGNTFGQREETEELSEQRYRLLRTVRSLRKTYVAAIGANSDGLSILLQQLQLKIQHFCQRCPLTPLPELPNELWTHILSFLPSSSRPVYLQVCTLWYHIINRLPLVPSSGIVPTQHELEMTQKIEDVLKAHPVLQCKSLHAYCSTDARTVRYAATPQVVYVLENEYKFVPLWEQKDTSWYPLSHPDKRHKALAINGTTVVTLNAGTDNRDVLCIWNPQLGHVKHTCNTPNATIASFTVTPKFVCALTLDRRNAQFSLYGWNHEGALQHAWKDVPLSMDSPLVSVVMKGKWLICLLQSACHRHTNLVYYDITEIKPKMRWLDFAGLSSEPNFTPVIAVQRNLCVAQTTTADVVYVDLNAGEVKKMVPNTQVFKQLCIVERLALGISQDKSGMLYMDSFNLDTGMDHTRNKLDIGYDFHGAECLDATYTNRILHLCFGLKGSPDIACTGGYGISPSNSASEVRLYGFAVTKT